MTAENPIILHPDEIKEKMLITIIGKDGKHKNFFVMKIDPEDNQMFHGYYENNFLKHPEKAAYSIQAMVHLPFIGYHKGLRHTTEEVEKEFKKLLKKQMETVIRNSAGAFTNLDDIARKYIMKL